MTKNFFFFNGCFDKNRIKSLISWSLQHCGDEITINLLENLKTLGFTYATQAGISLGIDDLKIPPTKTQLIYDSDLKIQLGQVNFKQGYLTGLEKFQQLIDTWHKTSEILKQNVINYFKITDVLNPVYMMAFSGARGNISQVRQLVGMRGLMADPQGQILDFPIKSNFREGLTLTEYLISCYGARKGLVDTALKTANAGYLTRRLVDVSHHIIVCEFDCKTNQSIVLNDILENQKIIISLQNRLVGRILAENIYINPNNLKLKSFKKKKFSSGSLKPSTGFYDYAPNEAVKQRLNYFASKPVAKNLTEFKFKGVIFLKKIKNNARILALFSKFLLFYFFCKSQKWIWNKKQQQYFPAKSINKIIFFVFNFNSKKLQKIFCDPLMVFWKIIYFKSIKKKKQLIATKNQEISFNLSVKIAKFKNQVKVRSPLTCEIKNSICQLCYGWSLAQGKLVSLGEAVGIIAGQSIGEPGTQLTMRTFHTGGVFSGEILTEIKAPFDGIIEFSDCLQGKLIRTPHGKIAFLTKVAGTFNFYQKQFFSSKADFHKVKTALTELKFNDCAKRKSIVVGDSHQPQLEKENLKKTSFQIPAFTILFHRNYEYVKKSHIIAEFSGDNNTESQEEPLYGTYDLKSEMEGELFFKYVVYDRKIKTKTKEIISSTTSKLGSIWVLSGKSLKQPIFIETFPQSGDLIDQNSIIGQYKTMLPDSGFITILPFGEIFGNEPKIQAKGLLRQPKNLTKILSNENRFTKTITNNLQPEAVLWNYNFNKLNKKKYFAVVDENLPQAFAKHNFQPLTSPNPVWLSSKSKLIQTSVADNNLTKFYFSERVKQPLTFSKKNQNYSLVVKKNEKKNKYC